MQTASTGTTAEPDPFDALIQTMQARYEALPTDGPHCLFATEAHSRARQIVGRETSDANGLIVGSAGGRHRIRVTDPAGTACYHVDRWD